MMFRWRGESIGRERDECLYIIFTISIPMIPQHTSPNSGVKCAKESWVY